MPKALDEFWTSPLSRAVSIWLHAEEAANPTISTMARGDKLALAMPRVRAVFAGEVRWSEASPGDRAVWVGRPRSPQHIESRHGASVHYWENLWDTLRIGAGATETRHFQRWSECDKPDGTCRMFGNYNIGAWYLCNLQCAGQLVGDHSMDIEQMYATVDRALEPGESVGANLLIGTRLVSQAKLSDLIVGHPVGLTLPERQNFSVELTWYRVHSPIQIVVHLEGPSRRAVQ